MQRSVLRAVVFGSLLVAACGGDDAASSPAYGGGAAGAAGAAPSKVGFIGVVSYDTATAGAFTNSVSAGFFDGPGFSIGKGCTREVIGACAVLACDLTNGGDQSPSPGTVVGAGTITVGGTSPVFSLSYDATTMTYAPAPKVPNDAALFHGGDTVTFVAAGDVVPAFSDALVAPNPVTVSSPALPAGAFSVDTKSELAFVWSGGTVGMISFNIRTTTLSGATATGITQVSCQFAASAGKGTISGAMLQRLKKSDTTTTAQMATDLSNTKESAAGDYLVHLAVGSPAHAADGKTPFAAAKVNVF